MKINISRFNIVLALLLLFIASCVKDGMPPDCKKPAKPTVNAPYTVNEGDTIRLSASGSGSGAQYFWSGPNNFYSTSANPQINFATIANSGTYWAKALVGYCYSDSAPVTVTVKSDTTCSLGDNAALFPNGLSGPLTMMTTCANSSGYQINSVSADSTIFLLIKINQKPTKGGVYTLTTNPNPGNGQIYYQIKDNYGNTFTNNTNTLAYVKVAPGKINVVVCEATFQGIGVFSANIACQ